MEGLLDKKFKKLKKLSIKVISASRLSEVSSNENEKITIGCLSLLLLFSSCFKPTRTNVVLKEQNEREMLNSLSLFFNYHFFII